MQYIRHRTVAIAIGLCLLAGMLLIQFGGMPLLGDLPVRLEMLTFDARLHWSKGQAAANSQTKIVIVDIDERALRLKHDGIPPRVEPVEGSPVGQRHEEIVPFPADAGGPWRFGDLLQHDFG